MAINFRNNVPINDWNNGSNNIIKCYYNNRIVYLKTTNTEPEPKTYLAHLTLNDGSIIDIEDDGTGVLKQSMTNAYSGSCVAIEITENCTELGAAVFDHFIYVPSVVVPNTVTKMNTNNFVGCHSLTSITLSTAVDEIPRGCFGRCYSLETFNIPNHIKKVGINAFLNCSGLTSVTIPDSVTVLEQGCFAECSSLPTITIPSGVTSIGNNFIQNSNSLTSVTCNAITPPTLGESAFYNTNDCPLYVPCESLDAYKSAWSAYESRITCENPPTPSYSGFCRLTLTGGTIVELEGSGELTRSMLVPYLSSDKEIITAEIGTKCTSIGNEAFKNKSKLKSVSIPSSVKTIGNYAFEKCYYVTSITIDNGVTTIGMRAFYECHSLKTLTIPASVTSIGSSSFWYCSRLTSTYFLSTTPPSIGTNEFGTSNTSILYVPAESVNAYKTANYWSEYADRIQAIP